ALLVRSQAVVVIRRSPVSVAWRDLRTLAGRVRTAAQPTRVDRERRFLDRPHVVQDVARSARKVRIAELDGTAVFGLLAFERFPRILDQPRNRLAGSYLRPDADHFDARDAVACVGRVVTLAAAQALY